MLSIFFSKDPGISILYSRKNFFKYIYVPRSLVYERVPLHKKWILYGAFFPPEWIKMGKNGARGVTIFRLQSITSSPIHQQTQSRQCLLLSLKYLVDKHWVKQLPQAPWGFMTIRLGTSLSRSLPSDLKCHVPDEAEPWSWLASFPALAWQCALSFLMMVLVQVLGTGVLSVILNLCILHSSHSSRGVLRNPLLPPLPDLGSHGAL